MQTLTIINPKTDRQNIVRAWLINPREVVNRIKAGQYRSARDISLALLSDDESIQLMERTQYGDYSRNNFALSIFENALDWRLGLAVLDLIDACIRQYRRLPKPFYVAVNRSGDVFLINKETGRVRCA